MKEACPYCKNGVVGDSGVCRECEGSGKYRPLTLDQVRALIRGEETTRLVVEDGGAFAATFWWAERLARARRDGLRALASALEGIGGDGVTMYLNNATPEDYQREIGKMVVLVDRMASIRAVSLLQAILVELEVDEGVAREIGERYSEKLLSTNTMEPQFGQPDGGPPPSVDGK